MEREAMKNYTWSTEMLESKSELFIGHIRPKDGKFQSLEEHIKNVALHARKNGEKIGLGDVTELIAWLHDIGKYSSKYQKYLRSASGVEQPNGGKSEEKLVRGSVDHATAGAQWIWRNLVKNSDPANSDQLIAQLIALCVASHHSGLIDCVGPESHLGGIQNNFFRRINKADSETHFEEVFGNMEEKLKDSILESLKNKQFCDELKEKILQIKKSNRESNRNTAFQCGLLARFLLSCLVDGDHTDAADFEDSEGAKLRQKGKYCEWSELITRLELKLGTFSKESSIDQLRSQISNQCQLKGKNPPGVFTLTVPTGGGKTLASLRFALTHSHKYKKDRIIYILPFCTILEQNANETKKILETNLEDEGNIVLEHHSNLVMEKQTWSNKILSQNWDAPIVYTTNVQVLEALFGSGTQSVRRMHQLANSVVIFDEIQALPIKCVHMFANAINFLVEQCNSTVVLCSATQPLLDQVQKDYGAVRINENSEIILNSDELGKKLKRVEIIPYHWKKSTGSSFEEVAELAVKEVGDSGSCLVVVNMKKSASEIYQLCKNRADFVVYHLSTNMCPAHRRVILSEMKEKLSKGEKVLCVSTQLIEAGVDIDFGCVIRSLAGFDSILQAAGRCNRNQKMKQLGRVYVVYIGEEKLHRSQVDISEGQSASRRVIKAFVETPERYEGDLLNEKAIQDFYQYYFWNQKEAMKYKLNPNVSSDNLLELLSTNNTMVENHKRVHGKKPEMHLRQAFLTGAKAFQVIDAPTQGVIVPYSEKGRELILKLYSTTDTRELKEVLKEAQQYSVNIFPWKMQKLFEEKAIRQIQEGCDVFVVDVRFYDSNLGLSDFVVGEEDFLHA